MKHSDDYSSLIGNLDKCYDYADWIHEDQTWAGEVEMHALARAIKFNIVLY